MTDAVSVVTTDTEDGQTVTLYVKISESLDAELADATRRTGASKSAIVRMALPLGINRLMERLTPQPETTNTTAEA